MLTIFILGAAATVLASALPVLRRAADRSAGHARPYARFTAYCAAAAFVGLTGCTDGPPNPNPRAALPLQTVPVDLPRYMGRWYVIANIPYFAERGFVASRAEWTLREDGRIDDAFVGRKGGFDGPEKRYQFVDTVKAGSGGGEWSVRLFWPIYVTQFTLYVDPDYRYTILGYPGKKLGWIFARQPQISDADYRALLARLDGMGYDTSRFRRVPQLPSQVGQPGFARAHGND
ncbi:MAG TPA: lipocalin family protein [Paraburkholderia sp.]|jgi:apolipoprotein D and lipocalin family protein|uniref:lipocalin family protein n=1 Tax=Paraburkholderia sp. TaxID=1926495 RepID=UPI002DEE1E35|nr:lipocalin family protein [Paraburkholderia sp.]